MSNNSFTWEEIKVFALMTLDLQVKSGLTDKHMMPDHEWTQEELMLKEVVLSKMSLEREIPHQEDIIKATFEIYGEENKEKCNKMLHILFERAKKDPELVGTLH